MSRRSRVRLTAIAVVLGLVLATGGGTVFVGSASAQGSVLVDSDITSDTTWESGTGPYRVVKTVDVAQGAKLTIEPGVVIEVAEEVNLTVEGNIQVDGTSENPVVFTSSKPEPAPGAWGSLVISGPTYQTTVIRHANFQYATDAVTVDGNQIVRLESVEISDSSNAGVLGRSSSNFAPAGELRITDSEIHHNAFGIDGHDEKIYIQDSTLTHNARSGIKLQNPLNVVDLRIDSTTVSNNDIGVNIESSVDQHNRGGVVSNIEITQSQIQANSGLGVRLFGDRITNVRFDDVDISGNGGSGLHLQDTGWKGGSRATRNITISASSIHENGDRGVVIDAAYSNLEAITITDTTLENNDESGLVLEADRSITGVSLNALESRMNGRTGIDIGGTEISGLALDTVTVFGNVEHGVTIDGTNVSSLEIMASTMSANGQTGLFVNGSNPGHQTTISATTIAGNGDGIYISGHAARITDSSIQHNAGIGVEFDAPTDEANQLSQSDLFGNSIALQVPRSAESLVADANGNYWGASSGPYHASINPEGEGNPVNGSLETVEFLDYASSPFGAVHAPPTASLEVETDPVHNGTAITISGGQSSDDGAVEWYRFQINDSTDTGMIQQSSITHTFETPGTYQINLTVVDDNGVRSASEAVLNLTVANSNQDPTGGEQTTTTKNSGSNGGSGGNNNTTTIDPGVTVPGFDIGAALIALLGAALLARRFAN